MGSFARLALPMKDSLGFFRHKESTRKKKNPTVHCVGLPEKSTVGFALSEGLPQKLHRWGTWRLTRWEGPYATEATLLGRKSAILPAPYGIFLNQGYDG
jgi:hypothetical protein